MSTNDKDTFFSRARADADQLGGRFKKVTETRVTGVPSYPQQPASSPWANDPVPPEAPLGFSVDELNGSMAPADGPVASDVATCGPLKTERTSDDPNQ